MNKRIWIVNKGNITFEYCDTDMHKWIYLKPKRPQQFDFEIAIKYINKHRDIKACENPQDYYNDRSMRRLLIRDAGIGDLLLLEPLVRQLYIQGNMDISIASRFPDVFLNHPKILQNIKMNSKDDIPENLNQWDAWDDLRSYSETCINRERKHRTDCYNQIFNLQLEDKEPQIYFDKKEKSILKRDKESIYIGLALDGSHCYRRYDFGNDLIDYILKKDKKYKIVIFGDRQFIKYEKNERVIDIQGKTNIREAFNVIRENIDYMISVDSGLMHVALSLHVPTVGIFSIIKPELRIEYYTGQKEIIYKEEMECIGCGSFHMSICKFNERKPADITSDIDFIAPCLDIPAKEIYKSMIKMKVEKDKNVCYPDKSIKDMFKKPPAIIKATGSDKKLIMPIIVLNEEKNLPRFIELVMSHKNIGKVIAIDGGSSDNTVSLLKKAGAMVYMHYYDVDYHDMQALQRNVSCSFVKDGEKILIMDIDECFSDELSDYLPALAESDFEHGVISRRTFDYFNDINDPKKSIKNYPDYQPRFFTWDNKIKWYKSPHHIILNTSKPVKINKDIIHFEKEGKDRIVLEKQWSVMQEKTKEVYV